MLAPRASESSTLVVRESPEASRYVVRRSLGSESLRVTLPGLLRTPELGPLLLGLTFALLLGISAHPLLAPLPPALALAAVGWQARGRLRALGLYDGEQLVGGLRLRLDRRRVRLMGVFVEPAYRGQQGSSRLLAAALDLVARELPQGELVAYAPTHPASRRLVERYLGGRRLSVPSLRFQAAQARLRHSLRP